MDNSCEPETSFDVFYEDYKDEDETLLQQVFGPSEDTFDAIEPLEPNDALVIDSSIQRQPPVANRPPPPVFKECTTLEECLGSGSVPPSDTADSWLTPLDYDYVYESSENVRPIRYNPYITLALFDYFDQFAPLY